jgi:hypothetical protein
MLFINYFQFLKTQKIFKSVGIISPSINVMNNSLYVKRIKNDVLYKPVLTLYKDRKIVKFKPKPDKYYLMFIFLTLTFGIFYIKFKMFIINIYKCQKVMELYFNFPY